MIRATIRVLLALALVGGAVYLGAGLWLHPQVECSVVDGDTLACNGERIRLNGIDAPEMAGHCAPGRQCVIGDPIESAANLSLGIGRGPVSITRLKRDRYGRTVAAVTSDGLDLSCWQILTGNARYVAKWDEGGRTKRACDAIGVDRD